MEFLVFRLYCDRAYQSFDDKQLYKWKDLVSSLSLGIGSAVVAALVKNSCCNIGFNVAYDLFNPMVDGVRTNIMGWESLDMLGIFG
jgi:hypothetical protein